MSELALFAKRLEQLRKQSGLSQKALAERTGIPQTTLSRWEKDTEPPLSGLRRLAQFFECSADYLCGLSSPPSDLRPGNWLVDVDLLEEAMNGYELKDNEAWAVAVPDRFRLVTSREYSRLRSDLERSK